MNEIDTTSELRCAFRDDAEAASAIITAEGEMLEQAVDRINPTRSKMRRIAGEIKPVPFIRKLNDIDLPYPLRVRAVADYCSAAILHERLSVNSYSYKKFTNNLLEDFEMAHAQEGGVGEPEESESSKRARGRKVYAKCKELTSRRLLPGQLQLDGISMGELHHYANDERDQPIGWHPDRERWEAL